MIYLIYSAISKTTGASAANASASVATEASVPSLNSAAHTGTLEVAKKLFGEEHLLSVVL